MLLSELPPFIQEIAKIREQQRHGGLNSPNATRLISMFNWATTPEGSNIWVKVSNGNYQPFYEFHVDEYEKFQKIRPDLFNKPVIEKVRTFPRLVLVRQNVNSTYIPRVAVFEHNSYVYCAHNISTIYELNSTNRISIIQWCDFKEIDE